MLQYIVIMGYNKMKTLRNSIVTGALIGLSALAASGCSNKQLIRKPTAYKIDDVSAAVINDTVYSYVEAEYHIPSGIKGYVIFEDQRNDCSLDKVRIVISKYGKREYSDKTLTRSDSDFQFWESEYSILTDKNSALLRLYLESRKK